MVRRKESSSTSFPIGVMISQNRRETCWLLQLKSKWELQWTGTLPENWNEMEFLVDINVSLAPHWHFTWHIATSVVIIPLQLAHCHYSWLMPLFLTLCQLTGSLPILQTIFSNFGGFMLWYFWFLSIWFDLWQLFAVWFSLFFLCNIDSLPSIDFTQLNILAS